MARVMITEALINQGKSVKGGWTQEQLTLLGVEWPPQKGWKKRACGKLISESIAQRFLALAPRSRCAE